MSLLRRLIGDARPYWGHLAAILFLSLLSTPIVLLLPVPLKIAVDDVIGAHAGGRLLIWTCVLTLALHLLQATQSYGTWVYQLFVGEKLVILLRARLFHHVQRLSLRQHDDKGTPQLLYHLQNDVAAMQYVAVYGLIPFFTSSLIFLGMFVVTWRLDAPLAVIALGVLPIMFAINRLHAPRSRRRWIANKTSEQVAISAVQEPLGSIRVVKAFAQEAAETERYRGRAEINLRNYLAAIGTETKFGLLIAAVVACASAYALYLGVRHVQDGILTLGNLLVVMAYLAQLFKPLESLSKQVATVQAALASAERVYGLLDELPEVEDAAAALRLDRAKGRIEFEDVSFRYGPRPTLTDISFAVKPGTRVGIVGPTGAGKTTLIHLLLRFFDPSRGRILLDGTDLRELSLRDLRSQFALVLQEPVLFSTSLAENIAYARPAASRAQIIEAAKLANAHDFITRLPDGYDTKVGERGMTLSGGERQRISIARAFLKDAPILVLDEPTSSVDADREQLIRDSLEKLRGGRTTFTISHRPSLLEGYDLVLRIDEGRLVEVGRA